MTERDFEAFKRAWENYPSQDNEGYQPDRGSFKSGFLAGLAHRDSEINTENNRLREALKKIEDLMPLNERERRQIARDALEGK